LIDIDQLQGYLSFKSAFNMEAGFELFWLSDSVGCKRGIYSNSVSQGTAPHIAAAANVSHPTKQGLVISVYIDTLLVCSGY
jgi:AGCS family alanine or glycine:cation symporter